MGTERVTPVESSAGLHVAGIVSPWGAWTCGAGAAVTTPTPGPTGAHNPLISSDDKVGIVTIAWQGDENGVENFTGVRDRLAPLDSTTIEYEFTGNAFGNLAAVQKGIPPELFGFIAALLILGIVFRTVSATLLPLMSAAAALGSGLAVVALLSRVIAVASFTTQVASLMVIGVGVDYALFIVTRHRRNLVRGMTVPDSIALALDTSGRAVLLAGATVCIAILGLCALGVSFLYGFAFGTSIAVALTMIASLTLLPAVLSLLGLRVLPRKQRRAVREGILAGEHHVTRWGRWSALVARRKLVLGLAAAAVIAVLAVPLFSIRLGHADQSNDPLHTTTRRGFDLIASAPGFGKGYNSVLELVISGPSATDPATLATAATRLGAVSDVNAATIQPVPLGRQLALVSFKSISSPQEQATTDLVYSLRSHLARELERGTTNHVYVFGQTAVLVDFAKVLAARMPLFFAAVIGLSFLLLMIAFRSLVIPLTAAVMNLFAAAASFGVMVAVFQWGWFAEALGIGSGGPIEAFIPVMFFAILFGLSMDYQVFLVSRMHEDWEHSHDNARAVRVGQSETGGIITAAALIMIAVFGGFLLGDVRAIKLFGLGLADAVFIDAFLLRTILVPALMHAFGAWNWAFPRWLDKITPRVSVIPLDEAPPVEAGPHLAHI